MRDWRVRFCDKYLHPYLHVCMHTCCTPTSAPADVGIYLLHTYIYIYIPTYILTYLFICVHTYLHIYLYIYLYMFLNTYVYVCICMCVSCVPACVCIFVCMHTFLHAYLWTSICTYMHIQAYIKHTCMCAYLTYKGRFLCFDLHTTCSPKSPQINSQENRLFRCPSLFKNHTGCFLSLEPSAGSFWDCKWTEQNPVQGCRWCWCRPSASSPHCAAPWRYGQSNLAIGWLFLFLISLTCECSRTSASWKQEC